MEIHGRIFPSTMREDNDYRIIGDEAIVNIYSLKGIKIAQTRIDRSDLKKIKGVRLCSAGGRLRQYIMASVQGKKIMLHRFLMNPPEGKYIDHIDNDTRNNTRRNLRIVTMQQNNFNWHTNKNGKRRGVGFDKVNSKFYAKIEVNKKIIWLGRYGSFQEAVSARESAEKRYFGEYAPNTKKIARRDSRRSVLQNLLP